MGPTSDTSMAASSSAMVSAAMGVPKFMGGPFKRGKDPEKRERKKERKKEQKAKEKGMKEAMKEDKESDTDDEDEGVTSSAMNWERMWSIARPSSFVARKVDERVSGD